MSRLYFQQYEQVLDISEMARKFFLKTLMPSRTFLVVDNVLTPTHIIIFLGKLTLCFPLGIYLHHTSFFVGYSLSLAELRPRLTIPFLS